MKRFREYIGLIRLPNLVMIAATQLLVRNCLIMPAFKASYFATGVFPSHLSDFHFLLLVFTTLSIAAAGYIINDYFDVHIDEINRPGNNIIGKYVSASSAKKIFYFLSTIGVMTGFYVSLKAGKPVMGLLPAFTAISLYMYSSFYKRRFLSGNILISLLCAISVLIVGLYEPEFYVNFNYLLWFAIPAFLLTFIRELIKDMEDIDGDERSQCKTAPIVIGIKRTKLIVYFLITVTSAYFIYILSVNFYNNTVISFWSLTGLFVIPLIGLFYLVLTAGGKKDFHYASLFTKILMAEGIVSMFPFWYFFLR